METSSVISSNTLNSILFGTGYQNSGVASLWAIRVMLCVLTLACAGSAISTFHFYSRYKHEAQASGRLKSNLQSQIKVLNADNRNLELQAADLSKTLEKTRVALALASRPSVSTTLPTPKASPSTTTPSFDP